MVAILVIADMVIAVGLNEILLLHLSKSYFHTWIERKALNVADVPP